MREIRPSSSEGGGAAYALPTPMPPERTSHAIGRPLSPSNPATRSLRWSLGHAAAGFYKQSAPPELARGLDGVPEVGGVGMNCGGVSYFRLYAFMGKVLCAWWAVYRSGARQMQKPGTDPFRALSFGAVREESWRGRRGKAEN